METELAEDVGEARSVAGRQTENVEIHYRVRRGRIVDRHVRGREDRDQQREARDGQAPQAP